jgi:hypothetical protein
MEGAGMKKAWNFDRCVTVLKAEIGLIKYISNAQNAARQAVMNREWADFDGKTAEVNRLGREFALLEEERAGLFSALAENSYFTEETPFYALVMGLPLEESGELSRLYRELKMETLKMRALNETFLAYLNDAKTIAAAYLEAVCPARGGKLYTRKGRKVSQDLRSIVINNRF